MGSSEQVWHTLAALPVAIIMYDNTSNTYHCNKLAQDMFNLAATIPAYQLSLTHLEITDIHLAHRLDSTAILPVPNLPHTDLDIALTQQHNTEFITLKFSQLSEQLVITVCEPCASPLAHQKQLAFDELISQISTELIDIQNDNLDNQIEKALQAIGLYCLADRSYLFKYSDDGQAMSNTHEWVNEGIKPFKEHLQNIPQDSLPFFFKNMRERHIFNVPDVNKLPAEAASEKAEFAAENIQSVLCIGLVCDQKLFGFIGCDCVKIARKWSKTDLLRIKLVGDMIANAMKNVIYKKKLEHTQQLLLQANEELQDLANLDSLTNIANRRQFDKSILQEIQRCSRTQQPLSLIMCDIDFFKPYNDNLGHQQGDEVLKKVASTLQRLCKRQGDIAARYGGEEFAIILPNTNTDHALKFTKLIQQAVAQLDIAHPHSNVDKLLTLSLGLYCCIPDKTTTPDSLIAAADHALYQAKAAGRNQVQTFT
ncbi:diguanylate cyclase domain-containing protein [Pseudoalteromonas mariniglutinosa]|uniref:sensor domain-containing diguanylate cyclase n=1 Tax=Pseudoalteromonas mariniglutinosa TaxID=206042 RepID=UPI00384E63B5